MSTSISNLNAAQAEGAGRQADTHSRPGYAVARPWQTNAALLLLGACLIVLSRQLVSEYDHFTIGFSGVSGWSAILYLAAALLVLTQPVNRFTFPIILAVAITCRLTTLYADPVLSSDIYRYVWDGIVQHAHINPYRYVPGDPALTFLRAPNQDIFDNINRRDYAHTIYPPAAQAIFYLITFISPSLTFMKTAMVLFEGLTLSALVLSLRHLGIRREQTLLFAWCPLLIWEIAGSGHVDSVVMAFVSLTLLFRLRRQPILTGLFFGLAVATKFYPLVLLPALLMRREPRYSGDTIFKGWDLKIPPPPSPSLLSVTPPTPASESSSLDSLAVTLKEEGIATGARYFLLELTQRIPGLHSLSTSAFLIFSALIFSALSLWALRTEYNRKGIAPPDAAFLAPAFALAAALMFLFSPHYAWYIAWLVPFFTLMPNLPILTYLLGFFYLYTTELGDPGPKMFLANEILYAGVLFSAILQACLRFLPLHRQLLSANTAPKREPYEHPLPILSAAPAVLDRPKQIRTACATTSRSARTNSPPSPNTSPSASISRPPTAATSSAPPALAPTSS